MKLREDSHPFFPGRSLCDLPHVLESLDSLVRQHNAQKARIDRAQKKGLGTLAEKLLRCAAENPYTPVNQLWNMLDSPKPAQRAAVHKELTRIKPQLAVFAKIRIEKTALLLIDLTEQGWAQVGAEPPKRQGGGGIEHRHFSHWIAEVGRRRGHQVELEFLVPESSHKADAAWLVNGRWFAFEVVITSVDNLSAHLDASLLQSNAVANLTIVTAQKSLTRELQNQLETDPQVAPLLDRVTFETITPYLKELWP